MKLAWVLCCAVLLAGATAARAQDVSVDYDRSTDFAKFKTYSWAAGVPAKNPLIDQHIRAAIDEQLAAKGLRKVEEGGDVNVWYYAAVDNELEVGRADWLNKQGWLRATGGLAVKSQSWEVKTGTLAVGISDPASKDLVWRGMSKTPLDNPSRKRVDVMTAMNEEARKAEKKVRKATEKMFKDFPPRRK